MAKKLIKVVTISTFRHFYVVEVDEGDFAPSIDNDNLEEYAQEFLGETEICQHPVTEEDFIQHYDDVNNYLVDQPIEFKLKHINRK